MDQQIQDFDSIREELKKLISQGENQNSHLPKIDDTNDQSGPHFSNKINPEVVESLSTKNDDLNATASHSSVDDNIKKMRSELDKTCKLFKAAGEAFESINFKCLKHRIRDLHISATRSEIDSVMQEKDVNKCLDKLTDIMGHKFGQHPGEFGDIPELSGFFKACSQLQHGLEELNLNRCQMDELRLQISRATNVFEQRAEEIQNAIKRDEKQS